MCGRNRPYVCMRVPSSPPEIVTWCRQSESYVPYLVKNPSPRPLPYPSHFHPLPFQFTSTVLFSPARQRTEGDLVVKRRPPRLVRCCRETPPVANRIRRLACDSIAALEFRNEPNGSYSKVVDVVGVMRVRVHLCVYLSVSSVSSLGRKKIALALFFETKDPHPRAEEFRGPSTFF